MYICKELQICFKALELISWLSHSNLAENVIFWVASTWTLLTRHCNKLSKIYAAPPWSAKVAKPLLLTDKTDLIFDNWKLQLQDKLKVNADYFPTAQAKIAYVFGCTGGDA